MSASGDIVVRPHRVGDIGRVISRQAILYHEEHGWDGTFEGLLAEISAAFIATHDPLREGCWIAERDRVLMGSVFLVKADETTAKLRMLYVEPAARGTGLGRRLVRTCVDAARARGYARLTLWTNDILHAARRIYESEGFVLVSEEKHHSFGVDLVGQYWTLDLG